MKKFLFPEHKSEILQDVYSANVDSVIWRNNIFESCFHMVFHNQK